MYALKGSGAKLGKYTPLQNSEGVATPPHPHPPISPFQFGAPAKGFVHRPL